jgi:hypothetical protein
MSTGLFTNSSQRADFVRTELLDFDRDVTDIFIATAFFTEFDVMDELASRDVSIRLVVRLGFPTSPYALAKAMRLKNVQLRYFNDRSFHPKLYIFGNSKALVGSANLTRAALLSNQEIVVKIEADDERLTELASVFSEYWSEAKVLTDETLVHYTALYRAKQRILKDIEDLDQDLEKQIGRHAFPNIQRGLPKPQRENIFLDVYRRAYQACIDAFRRLKDAYLALGRRKFRPEQYPLRLEINLFINYVRDVHARGESWRQSVPGWDNTKIGLLHSQLAEWIDRNLTEFESRTVTESYPRIMTLFSDREHLLQATDDELFEALRTVTSFEEQLRFHRGGLPALRAAFFGRNSPERIRESLAYLVFDAGDPIVRMANLLFNPDLKINEFGSANVQELIGWTDQADLPVVNGRTTKILRYFGFEVQQLS